MGKIVIPTLVFLCFVPLSLTAEDRWRISSRSTEVPQGGIAEISLSGAEFTEVTGRLGLRSIPFFREEDGSWRALIGIDLEELPGPSGFVLRIRESGRSESEKTVTLRVQKKDFPSERLSVASSFDQLDDAVVKRIEREKQRFDNLWAADPGPRHWSGPFMPPLPLEVTSPFGFRRIVNGVARSPHGGVDLKAREGTEVKAANDGVVALLDEFFFTGRTLVLNHGGGLYTMYFHLADFLVKEAGFVRKGEVIGLAGMTGRVTGPHLHWGVRLNGARVDPLALPGIESEAR